MRVITRLIASSVPLLLALAGVAAAPASAAPASPVVGHVYVNDNPAGANTVAGFNRHANGQLTPLSGSPFRTGGAGTGSGLASQGALQQSADGRYLLAVDAGSNQVSVLKIRPDGSLAVADVESSNGVKPVSIAVHGSLVYVANAADVGGNYTGFTLSKNGHLTPLAGSTVSLPDGSEAGDILFNSTGTTVVGTRVNTSIIDSFTVGSDGRLTAAPNSPLPAQGQGPFGSEFRPTNPNQLFVSNAHDGAGNGTISAFSVDSFGSLTSIGSSPFANLQTAPCWVEITHDGNFLFSVNTASGSVSRFSIAADGTLTLLGSTPLSGTGLGAVDARLDPSGSTLSVVDGGANAVTTLAVNGGDLTELSSSPTPLPAGGHPSGIVVN